MHPLYDILRQDLRTDVTQMAEEGHDEAVLLKEVEAAEAAGSVDALLRLQEELWTRPSPAGFPYEEPSDWEAISATFPDPESHDRFGGTDEELADRLLGGWLGRCAGCQLGKPLEGVTWPESVEETLKVVGSWPLTDYMEPAPSDVELPDNRFFNEPWRSDLARGRFDHVAPDDDILYAMVSQRVLEDHGPDFTPEQSLRKLIDLVAISSLFASGRSMYRTGIFGLKPPQTAVYGNPCRQSLGAQIRCDPWGWGAPANPGLAARMAYKDAANSQVCNGIYSGIFFSVLLADVPGPRRPGARGRDGGGLRAAPLALRGDAARRQGGERRDGRLAAGQRRHLRPLAGDGEEVQPLHPERGHRRHGAADGRRRLHAHARHQRDGRAGHRLQRRDGRLDHGLRAGHRRHTGPLDGALPRHHPLARKGHGAGAHQRDGRPTDGGGPAERAPREVRTWQTASSSATTTAATT